MKTDIDRFMEKVMPEPNTGCWLWTACSNKHNYGMFRTNNKTVQAHRFSYENFVCEFDKNLHVLHKCDVTCCVNPDHLFLGDQYDNMNDMTQKGRRSKILNNDQVKCIRGSAKRSSELAAEFGVTRATIWNIRSNKTWGL